MVSRFTGWLAGLARKLVVRFCRPRLLRLQFRYLKAGLAVADEPIPWNAETVQVEALVRGPRRRLNERDFVLSLPGRAPLPAVRLDIEEDGTARVLFQLAPPLRHVSASLYWRWRCLGKIELPFLSAESFLQGLRIDQAMVRARLRGDFVPGQAFVVGQPRELLLCARLHSPTSLLPLLDWGIQVSLRGPDLHEAVRMAPRLTTAQIAAREAAVAVTVPTPRCDGWYPVHWTVKDSGLAVNHIAMISQERMEDSLYLADDVYRRQRGEQGEEAVAGFWATESRPYPGFLVASREPGLAALCRLDVLVHTGHQRKRPRRLRHELLITDLPTFLLPVESLKEVTAVELFCADRLLGLLSRYPTPSAAFNAEGGFFAPEYFPWTALADAELEERLTKLVDAMPEGHS